MKEKLYCDIALLAESLYENGNTMSCSELLAWINNREDKFEHPYVSVRRVILAAHRRSTDSQKEALESVFTDKLGRPLLR